MIPERWQARVIPAFVLTVYLVLTTRLYAFIDHNAVNVLFSDQWDLYNPLFRGQGALEMFLYKHGPHRQGLGGLVMMASASLTAWNSRVDAFACGAVVAMTTLFALLLARRLSGRWRIGDVIIPLIFLTTAQYESLTVVSDPGHSLLPACMTVLVTLAWLIDRPIWRYTTIAVLNALLIFTGFGLFQGLLVPAILALEVVYFLLRRERARAAAPGLALLAGGIAWALFFVNYLFSPIVSCFVFPHPRPLEYFPFVSLMFARFIGLDAALAPGLAVLLGSALLLICCVLAFVSGMRLLRNRAAASPIDRTIAILTIGTLMFCANTAVGRVCTGVNGGQASRYMALVAPAFLAFYLAIAHIALHWGRVTAVALLAALLLPIPLPQRANNDQAAGGFAEVKRRWRECYLVERDIEQCNQLTGFPIFPIASWIVPKLDYLEARQLNLFHREANTADQ